MQTIIKPKKIVSNIFSRIQKHPKTIIFTLIALSILVLLLVIIFKDIKYTSQPPQSDPSTPIPKPESEHGTIVPSLKYLLVLQNEESLTKTSLESDQSFNEDDYDEFTGLWIKNLSTKFNQTDKLNDEILYLENGYEDFDDDSISIVPSNVITFIIMYLKNIGKIISPIEDLIAILNTLPEEYKNIKPELTFILSSGNLANYLIKYRTQFISKFSEIFNKFLSKSKELSNSGSEYYKIKTGIEILITEMWEDKKINLHFCDVDPSRTLQTTRVLENPEGLKAYVLFQAFWVPFVVFEDVFSNSDGSGLNTELVDYMNISRKYIEKVKLKMNLEFLKKLKDFILYLKFWSGEFSNSQKLEKWKEINGKEIVDEIIDCLS